MFQSIYTWLRDALGIVRLRQLVDQARHRLSFVPGLYVLGSLVVAQLTLLLDRSLADQSVPQVFATTVDSARSVFTAIAGGLITSITLLLSMMLITIQLASSQFSPRTLRDWLGDPYLKHTVGLALGTTVFSLLALRSTRSFSEDGTEIIPHTSVILAVVLGVVSLFAVVRSVDHVTQSLQIGSVARRIAADTVDVINAREEIEPGQRPNLAPSSGEPDGSDERQTSESDEKEQVIPDDAIAVEALAAGWVQQIRPESILDALPDGSTGYVVVPLGSFVPTGAPLMWIAPAPADDDSCREELQGAFALGDTRTLQQDIGFGLVQLTDIAVRALSPGVNDPGTANDLIVHLGDVMLTLWAQPMADGTTQENGRTLVQREPNHEEHLRRSFDPIRRYGAADPTVMLTMVRTLRMIVDEVERRSLPGPVEPLERMIADTVASAEKESWVAYEVDELDASAHP